MQANIDKILARDESTDDIYVAFGVLESVYIILKDQSKFCNSKDRFERIDYKSRVDAFLKYYESLHRVVQQYKAIRNNKIKKL